MRNMPGRLTRRLAIPGLAGAALTTALVLLPGFALAETVRVYGPGGPLPAMQEAAATFAAHPGTTVEVAAGPTPSWIEKAKADAGVVLGGSEVVMSDFQAAMGNRIDPASVRPPYLRAAAILVRPGNPKGIKGVADLLRPGHRVLLVNGAGQQGLWEDVAGRTGRIEDVRAVRADIATFAPNSAAAREAWAKDGTLDARLIWTVWQVASPALADQVAVEPERGVFRVAGVALTKAGAAKPEAKTFASFLEGPEGHRIFARRGWIAPAEQ